MELKITECSAGVVVYKHADTLEFLLLWHGGNYWNFPKGHVESGEDPLTAALREVAEETGLTGLVVHPTFAQKIHYSFSRNARTISKEATFYLARSDDGEVRISREHKGFRWFQYREAWKRLRYPQSRSILRKAHQILNMEASVADEK